MKAAGWTFLVIGGLILMAANPMIGAGVAFVAAGMAMLANL